MQVETYECIETAAEPIEACEEAVAIMEQLGLDGQKALVNPKSEEKPAARCPYREITKEESFAYRVLCPHSHKLKDYARSPIPLRVLQIAAHAQSLNNFKEMIVWDAESAIDPDPVLVATMPGAKYSWETRTFILARWGEVLEPLVVLVRRACEKKREEFRAFVATMTSQTNAERVFVEGLQDSDIVGMEPTAKYDMVRPR